MSRHHVSKIFHMLQAISPDNQVDEGAEEVFDILMAAMAKKERTRTAEDKIGEPHTSSTHTAPSIGWFLRMIIITASRACEAIPRLWVSRPRARYHLSSSVI
jgi:hypothetical protein